MNKIFGIKFDLLNFDEIISKIKKDITKNIKGYIVTLNAIGVNLCKRDPEFKQIVNSSQITTPDGSGILLAFNLLKKKKITKIAGVELFVKMLELANNEKYSVYFFGSKDDVLDALVEKVKKDYPNIIINGYRNGYFNDQEEEEIINDINRNKTNFLFLAMGMPKQEKWLCSNLDKLNINYSIGLGGSFDVVSGKLKRAPKIYMKFHIEWLYRFIQEPKRFVNIKELIYFLLILFKKWVRKGLK